MPTQTFIKKDLAENVNSFFVNKIENIRNGLKSKDSGAYNFSEKVSDSNLDTFEPCNSAELKVIIAKSSNASCDLDPIPAPLLKKCLISLLPFLTDLVDLSLKSGKFPKSLKTALVRPLLKKPSLNANEQQNYRPVSNIPYVSKLIEKVVAKRLNDYMCTNSLHEEFQSGYRKYHGTETALLKIQDDILRALDQKK